jgi:hypothetical protein
VNGFAVVQLLKHYSQPFKVFMFVCHNVQPSNRFVTVRALSRFSTSIGSRSSRLLRRSGA